MQKLKWWIILPAVLIVFFLSSFLRKSPFKDESPSLKSDTVKEQFSFSIPFEVKDEIDAYFTRLHKFQGFNGTVLIGQRDSVFFTKSYGYSNWALRDSLNQDDAFQLASVSKQFTAVSILQLYEKGLLRLDDSIQKFFPDFPYTGITIHQLLTHRSGLPNYHYFMQYIPITSDTALCNQDYVQTMTALKPAIHFKPNRRYQYSNTGYMLLAAIVEKVSGMTFEDYTRVNLFDPLGMKQSFVSIKHKPDTTRKMAQGYIKGWKMAESNYLDGASGDKGVYCTAHDLFRWDQGLYKGIIINRDTLALAFRPMGKPSRMESNYGYGWRMFKYGAHNQEEIYFHGGWWHGFRSLLVRIPQDSTTIIVLKNRSTGAGINTKLLLNMIHPLIETSNDTTDVENEIL